MTAFYGISEQTPPSNESIVPNLFYFSGSSRISITFC